MKKYTDNYNAKFEIWAKESKVYPMPKIIGFPPFKSQKFNSYDEMNAWKNRMLDKIAFNGGVKWTK